MRNTHRGVTVMEMLTIVFCFSLLLLTLSKIFQVVNQRSRKIVAETDFRIAFRTLSERMTHDIRTARYVFSPHALAGRFGQLTAGNPRDFELELRNGEKIDIKFQTHNSSDLQPNKVNFLTLVIPESAAISPTWEVVSYFVNPNKPKEFEGGLLGYPIQSIRNKGVNSLGSGLPSDLSTLDMSDGTIRDFECYVSQNGSWFYVSQSGDGVLLEIEVVGVEIDPKSSTKQLRRERYQSFASLLNAI